ncbi:MAG: DNA-3-methyladenine glycosylase family protein [Thermovenabulum sp.]|uniref:DNA-3-methyladenine glycosylase family protein n=1 Tax=Thermovenabulum sp. TaxID=3100335 RepID=UPI003C7B2F31
MRYVFTDVKPFNLEAMLEGGQAFRWEREGKGYRGVVKGRVISVSYDKDTLMVDISEGNNTKEEDIKFIRDYFDLDRDYEKIEEDIKTQFPELEKVIVMASGNRILHQDPWETLVSFIISANNSINNIKKVIDRLSQNYGRPIEFKGRLYYSFPSPEVLSSLSEEEIRCTRCGFRGKYIINAARMVREGVINLEEIKGLPTEEAIKELTKIPGVGVKVASCILLFSYKKFDSFPVDVWIKRAVEGIYFNGASKPVKEIINFAQNKFGNLAGFIQQYLFYYIRNNKMI